MNGRQPLVAGVRQGPLKTIALCLGLAGLGFILISSGGRLWAPGESYVDFSQRASSSWPVSPALTPGEARPLCFAVATMVSAEATFSTYKRLVERISRDVGRQDAFVVRPSYADVRRDLEQGKVDVALVCTGTFVHAMPNNRIKLLVQPEFEDGAEYRCLFIVPTESTTNTVEDLRGVVMAFTDPESNTGCLVPAAMLANRGYDAKSFFGKVVFTGSHDRSILAVALGVVDVAAVDALIWRSMLQEDPSLSERVRVIWKSEQYGPPPVVIPRGTDPAFEASLRKAFLALDKDPGGRAILSSIGIRRFVPARPESYRSAIALYERLHEVGGTSWP